MAKRKAFLHLGPTHTGSGFLDGTLAAHEAALAEQGVLRPARSSDEMFRAAVEIRRTHKAWGYRRREVEGTWSAICRRAHKGRGTVVVSEPQLAAATADEIALLLDRLDGFDVHVVLTVTPPTWTRIGDPGHDLPAVLDRWGAALAGPDRVHVVVAPPTGDPAAFVWDALGRIVGFDAASLPVRRSTEPAVLSAVPTARQHELTELAELAGVWGRAIAEGGHDVHGEVADLAPLTPDARLAGTSAEERLALTTRELDSVLDELARQRVRNAALEARNDELARKRKKLKRRLSDAHAG